MYLFYCWSGNKILGTHIKLLIIVLVTVKVVSLKNRDYCGTLVVYSCSGDTSDTGDAKPNANSSCKTIAETLFSTFLPTNLNKTTYQIPYTLNHVTQLLNVTTSDKCHVTLCDDKNLMGYCAQFASSTVSQLSEYQGIFQSNTLSVQCACKNESLQIDDLEANYSQKDEAYFDRNYVGVVYSPYDKYWITGPNNTKKRVSWKDYSEDELRLSLRNVGTKFSLISTYGMGTVSNKSEWYDGDKIAFIPKLSAELNLEAGYPLMRVSVGIFRKDDVNVIWKSKEMYNAIEAAKYANNIFPGTVWGITVTSQYVSDVLKAQDVTQMINEVKKINQRDRLRLKVGIRLDKCSDFIAPKRPEDDSNSPAYGQTERPSYNPMTSFQASLYEIAKNVDYILCLYFPLTQPQYSSLPIDEMLNTLQNDLVLLRETLKSINPRLKLVVETGIPSKGTGNGVSNTLSNFKAYWLSMAKFAKDNHMMLHMFEATDQPWKTIQDERPSKRFDVNGPNGTEGHYGWWKLVNNSYPLIYQEKVMEPDANSLQDDGEEVDNGESFPLLLKVLIACICGIALLLVASTGYLWRKLHKANQNVISSAYVEQFLSGGDKGNDEDSDYAVALRIPYDRKFELVKGNFQIDKAAVMGSGQSGIVLKGTIKGMFTPVAFKCTTSESSVADVKSLMSEIKIMSLIGEHDNIVCLLGAYTKKIQRGIVYVALEYCPNGSLERFIRQVDPNLIKNELHKKLVNKSNAAAFGIVNPGYVTTTNLNGYVTNSPGISFCGPESDMVTNLNGYVSAPPCTSFGEHDTFMLSPTSNGYVTAAPANAMTGYVASFQIDGISSEVCNSNSLISSEGEQSYVNVPKIGLTTFFKWSYQIACAMEFVSRKSIVHADLASRNILVTSSLDHVKVADFGLSKKLYQEIGVVHDKDTPLPWRWMAPESLRNLVFSVNSDVWSYGVTIWEIFSLGEVPYHGISYDMQFVGQLEIGMRLPCAKFASNSLHDQLLKCWSTLPQDRPSFTDLKHLFKSLILESQSPS